MGKKDNENWDKESISIEKLIGKSQRDSKREELDPKGSLKEKELMEEFDEIDAEFDSIERLLDSV